MPKIKKYKNLNNFKLCGEIKNTDNSSSHKICLLKKIKNQHVWYAKVSNKKEAILEVVAQEFFRLVLPQQPKTRWTREKKNGASSQYYVLSKEIPDFQDKFFLSHENNISVLKGKVSGLAATQVLSLLL